MTVQFPGVHVVEEAFWIVLGREAGAVELRDELRAFDSGRTDAYLSPPVGEAKLNLLRMARETLALELGAAVREARTQKTTVRREAVRLQAGQQKAGISVVQGKPPKEAGLVWCDAATTRLFAWRRSSGR